ncbi:MAG: EAL domain-containing protein [Sedimenticola sp.]
MHDALNLESADILLVDDTIENLKLLTDVLTSHGYNVRAVSNGKDALETVNLRKPDLILLDVKMPGMDGFEVCRRLKADGNTREVPVIFITATTDPKGPSKGLQLGAVDYIMKPFVIDEVLARTKTHIELYRMRQHLAQESEESKARFRRLVEGLKEEYFFYAHGVDGVFNYVSPSVEEVLGYTPEEFMTHYADYFTDNEINQKGAGHSEASMRGEHQPSYEVEVYRKDGKRCWLEVKETPLFDSSGKVMAVEGIAHDITVRKTAEEKLRQAAAVFENTTDGVIVTDAQKAIVTINQAATEITGYKEEEVLGKKPSIWKSDRHAPSFYQAMWATLKQQEQWQGEIWNRRKNGEIFPCRQNISAVRDVDTGEIIHYVSIMSDISAIQESQERLKHLAHHDPLTNLPNRLLFNARLEHAMARARREKCWIGVMHLDLDNFKPINDGLGHPVGDKVLQAVAERLSTLVRRGDTVARVAGDEFALLVEEVTDTQDVSHVAGKILSSFEEPFQIEEHKLHLTPTIGISQYPDDGTDVTALVKNADTAMHRGKQRGKNRYCFYTVDLTEAALERLQLENELRVALKRNEFRVYYQPQYCLSTGQLTGAEALVRWEHSELGLVSPIKFIPLAESTGLIIPLGEYVLREACTQMKVWQRAGHAIEHISVNVAGRQIQRGSIVETVRKVLEETELEPQCLELEITESFIMEQADKAISTLDELQSLGVTLAIDDFGTGYSSLSYLKRLPIDKLKIDRSFIKDIPHDADGEAIAKAIIALGKSLQLHIIAEGVETEEQKEFVRLEGCDEVQGYFYSRPLPEKDFSELLKNPK